MRVVVFYNLSANIINITFNHPTAPSELHLIVCLPRGQILRSFGKHPYKIHLQHNLLRFLRLILYFVSSIMLLLDSLPVLASCSTILFLLCTEPRLLSRPYCYLTWDYRIVYNFYYCLLSCLWNHTSISICTVTKTYALGYNGALVFFLRTFLFLCLLVVYLLLLQHYKTLQHYYLLLIYNWILP